MSDANGRGPGEIGWVDLTVPDADQVSDFYKAVAGWTVEPVDMGGYQDYGMNSAGGQTVAGICHARGANAGQPPVWMIYIMVSDLDESLKQTVEKGGKVRGSVRSTEGYGRFCVIEDPAGAVAALFEPASKPDSKV
jgi:predicted enzyme related to lactoylglutathione lyase